jgi:tRNA(fMet)-specific endonuclease VapC
MKFVLDTSAFSEFNRGNANLKQWFHSDHEIIVPLIVIGELRAGFAAGNRREENELLLRRFLGSPNVHTVTITDDTTHLFAQTYSTLRLAGTPVGTNDLWIAAMSIEYECPLLTVDSDFSRIESLKLVTLH